MAGLYQNFWHYLIFTSGFIVHVFTGLSIFVLIGAAAPNPTLALVLSPIVVVIFILFGGFFINSENIPVYFSWFRYVSFFQYTSRILFRNEFVDAVYACDTNSTACGGMNGTHAGYNELVRLGIEDTVYWESYLILVAMIIIFRFLAFLAIYFTHVEKR